MADCPLNKRSKPSGEKKEEEIASNVNDSCQKNQQKHKKKNRIKFANLTVEVTLARGVDDCNLSLLTHAFRNIAAAKV